MRQKLQRWSIIILLSLRLWTGLIEPAQASNGLSPPNQRHILERLSFGVTSAQTKLVNEIGIEAYIQSQLSPQLVPESAIVNDYLATFSSIHQQPIELQKQDIAIRKKLRNSKLSIKQKKKLRREIGSLNAQARDEAMDAHLVRAIYSNRQLQEVMVDFWFNHFNVYAEKGSVELWLSDYENKIRTHALGNFRDLLIATAKHPAMLIYLDNRKNTDPNSPGGKKNQLGLNENYARELMELHTLGVNAGYSQDDVIALARILTGWGINTRGNKSDGQGFSYYDNRHDQEDKLFLGQKISANGMKEGEQAIDILVKHPATAHFISYKLAQYFVADRPPNSLVDKLSQEFGETNGNIKLVLNALIHSEEFNSPEYYKQKFKTPYQYVISLVRMGEIEQPNLKRVRGMLEQLSMPLYMCLAPTGYQNIQEAWLNPQAMLQRTGLATAIANGTLNRSYLIEQKQLTRNFGELSSNTKQVVTKSPRKLRSALIMGSPESMYR